MKIIFLLILIITLLIILFCIENFSISYNNLHSLIKDDILFDKVKTDNHKYLNDNSIIDHIYPIGSLFMCDIEANINPNDLFDNTKWEILNESVGRFMMIRRSDDNKNLYGGVDIISANNLPMHTHDYLYRAGKQTFGKLGCEQSSKRDMEYPSDDTALSYNEIHTVSNFIPKYLNIIVYQRIS